MSKSIDRYISIRSAEYMRKQCGALKLFGIVGFNHDISFAMGEISILSTNENIFKTWYDNRIPAVCTDESGRILPSGVYLDSYLKSEFILYSKNLPMMLSKINASRVVHIVEREKDCQSMYSFVFNQPSEDLFLQFLLNHISELQNFIESYKLSSIELITEAKKTRKQDPFTLRR